MALLPYSVRQVTQRSKGRRDRGDRGDRDTRDLQVDSEPMPTPPEEVSDDVMAENDEFIEAGIDDTVEVEAGAE